MMLLMIEALVFVAFLTYAIYCEHQDAVYWKKEMWRYRKLYDSLLEERK